MDSMIEDLLDTLASIQEQLEEHETEFHTAIIYAQQLEEELRSYLD